MRRTIGLAGALLLGVLAFAPGARAAGGPRDFVTVGGQHLAGGTGPELVAVGVSVHSGPTGEDPKGSFTFTVKGQGQHAIHAKVTCLIVAGNEAFATARFTQPKSSAGQIVVLDAVDNGTPGRSSTPDMIRFSFSQIVLVSPDCYLPLLPPVAVQRGNVAVHDASP